MTSLWPTFLNKKSTLLLNSQLFLSKTLLKIRKNNKTMFFKVFSYLLAFL